MLGIRLAPRAGHGSFDAQVRSTFADYEMLSCALVPLLDARTVLHKTYLKLDSAVKALTKADPLCVRLMSWSSLEAWGLRLAKTRAIDVR